MHKKTDVFLVATAPDLPSAQREKLPCVRLIYRIGESGALQRAQISLTGRGGLLGIYEAPGLSLCQPERLARDLQAECARRGLSGVVLDLEAVGESADIVEAICAALARLQVPHFVPEGLHACAPEGKLILSAAVSGGSFAQLLDTLCQTYGAERVCLDLARVCADFSMPSYSPDGAPLSPEELDALQKTHRAEAFFSPRLCQKYFTYRKQNGSAHFVLFDDADTAAQKLALAEERGIGTVFLLYSEWGGVLRQLLG